MNRRHVIAGLATAPLLGHGPARASAPIYIGDMHFHTFFGVDGKLRSQPVGAVMAGGRATLVAWSLVGDLLWTARVPRGIAQRSVPEPGETLGWFERELKRIKGHVASEGLKIVSERKDVELALAGDPHIVLSVEGASFVENDVRRVQMAYDLGVRHLQLVHFIRNTLGDFQTETPEHNGLTGLGKEIVAECNRLGILIDMAHATGKAVFDALAISTAPMVWSHGSVTRDGKPEPTQPAWRARRLTLDVAKAIAAKGGVVGLWVLRQDVGNTLEAYGDRLSELAAWLGDEHVAFGTDINGLGPDGAILSTYAELRRVIEYWQRTGVTDARIRRMAIENYARVLSRAMALRKA
jgi:membrane dipeptidase